MQVAGLHSVPGQSSGPVQVPPPLPLELAEALLETVLEDALTDEALSEELFDEALFDEALSDEELLDDALTDEALWLTEAVVADP